MIKWIDFCSLWVINPTGLERLQRGSHREAFLMDSHRETSIHRANEIGLQDRGFRGERKTHKRKLMSNRITFRKRGFMMRNIMGHAMNDLACVLSE